MSTTATWTPSVTTANELWSDALAVAAEIVKHGVHFVRFEIVTNTASGYALPEVRTKSYRGADVTYLSVTSTGDWKLTDAVGDVELSFPLDTHPRTLAQAALRVHNTATA